jgi:hypothetical protein
MAVWSDEEQGSLRVTGAVSDPLGAVAWLQERKFDVIVMGDATLRGDLPTWSGSAKDVALRLAAWSAKPHTTVTLPVGLTRTIFQRGGELQVNRARLEVALEPYRDVRNCVTGLQLGSLTGGNTKVVSILDGETYRSTEIRSLLHQWLERAPQVQDIGRSPGQTYGEFAVGITTLGLAGFRFQQPVEIYPLFLYRDATMFRVHVGELLGGSFIERLPKASHPGQYLLKQAPALLQASFVLLSEHRLETRRDAHENRRRWALYKKPKLAHGLFDEKALGRLVECLGTA